MKCKSQNYFDYNYNIKHTVALNNPYINKHKYMSLKRYRKEKGLKALVSIA